MWRIIKNANTIEYLIDYKEINKDFKIEIKTETPKNKTT